MKSIKMKIECPECKGTGVYVGMAERDGASVVCNKCKGTGAFDYEYHYNEFTGRKVKPSVTRVYKSSMGYVIAPKKIEIDGVNIEFDKEGVSYEEFLNGKLPEHIELLGCPMLTDQGACHHIEGFIDECNDINGGWISMISRCKNQCNKSECWKRFKKGVK